MRQVGAGHVAPRPRRLRAEILIFGLLALLFIALRAGIPALGLGLRPATQALIVRVMTGALAITVILGLSHVLDRVLVSRTADPVARFNLTRIVRLGTVIAVAFTVVSIVFVSWYTAVHSVGLVSLVLGFALQTPITSFIGWIYILVRQPYRIGDRIAIGDVHGDVIDVGYLDTTVWEFGGELLDTEGPSGRIVKFPNSTVLNSPVYNYSWPLFPYVWNEITFQLGYDSDLAFVAETMKRIVQEELGEDMAARVATYRNLIAQTPITSLEVQDQPSVQFRPNANTWIQAIVRYLVMPREGSATKTRLVQEVLAALQAHPDRVRFPKGDAR